MMAPRMLWLFWFGSLGPVRRRSIDMIMATAGVEVTLLTDLNYTKVLERAKLHPLALSPALSKVHLSDYLRAFVMHHYGGAYQDVKPTKIDWSDKLAALNNDSNAWFIGADEHPGFKANPAWDVDFGKDGLLPSYSYVRSKSKHCITSNGYYAAKPNTPLTERWLQLVTKKMTHFAASVELHPAPKPRCCPPKEHLMNGYPIYWTELHGNLLHPLQTVFCRHVKRFKAIYVGAYRDDSPNIT